MRGKPCKRGADEPERRDCRKCGKSRKWSMYSAATAVVCDPCKRLASQQSRRDRHLAETYGLEPGEYTQLLDAQDGKCAGCGGSRRYFLHVDHDHALQAKLLMQGVSAREAARRSVRGLLCKRCNGILRDVRDNAPNLRGLAVYLDKPPARKVLRTAA